MIFGEGSYKGSQRSDDFLEITACQLKSFRFFFMLFFKWTFNVLPLITFP